MFSPSPTDCFFGHIPGRYAPRAICAFDPYSGPCCSRPATHFMKTKFFAFFLGALALTVWLVWAGVNRTGVADLGSGAGDYWVTNSWGIWQTNQSGTTLPVATLNLGGGEWLIWAHVVRTAFPVVGDTNATVLDSHFAISTSANSFDDGALLSSWIDNAIPARIIVLDDAHRSVYVVGNCTFTNSIGGCFTLARIQAVKL
jgi:hypothetical protein